jgi:murein DD-endopeptidase MepM/ murein hydrolase activator NlpD
MKFFHTAATSLLTASLSFAAPQAGDQDFDGVPDSMDPCPRSIASQEQMIPGCSCVDLMLYPEVAGDPVVASVERLMGIFEEHPELFNTRETLGSAKYLILVSLESMREADISMGNALLQEAMASMETSRSMFESFILDLQEHLEDDFANPSGDGTGPGGPTGGAFNGAVLSSGSATSPGRPQRGVSSQDRHADGCDDETRELLYWQVRAEEFESLIAESYEMMNLFSIMNELSGPPVKLFGHVEELNDGMRMLLLEDGTQVVLPWLFEASDGLYLGQEIMINGKGLDGQVVADDMVTIDEGVAPWLDPTTEVCLQLRFAPATAYMTSLAVKHEPAGYLEVTGGLRYELEQGMAIAAEEAGQLICEPWSTGGPNNEVMGYRDSFHVSLSYLSKSFSTKTVTLATDLTASSQPPFLPSDIYPDSLGTLTVIRNRQSFLANDLSPYVLLSSPEVVGTSAYTLRVQNRGHFALYEYDRVAFTLEDNEVNGFQAAQITGVSLSANLTEDPGTLTQSASGYAIVNGAVQYSASIGPFQPFAIRNHDFYPVWPSDGAPNEHWTGVTHPAGLEWPTISGTRNNKPFRYTSRLPEIVRDAVSICGDPAGPLEDHSYYRMPFQNSVVSTVSQGNNGSFTHQGGQQFAYDFVAPLSTPLVASRPGIVNSVRSNVTVNCQAPGFSGSCPFFGNFVSVVHQDGSEAFYLHMVAGSPSVVVGQEVRRGDVLGLLGNTGNSTGPHVHFHVNPAGSNATMPARFELNRIVLIVATFMQCVIPLQGWSVGSTNLP